MRQFLLLVLLSSILFAAPAYHGKRTFTQPDGSKVEYRNQGDEYLHWSENQEGDILLLNPSGDALEYAKIKEGNLVPSGEAYSKSRQSRSATKSSQSHRVSREDLKVLYRQKRQQKHRLHRTPNR